MKILFLSYACEPGAGSEYGVGWNVPLNMAETFLEVEVYVLTRSRCRERINETLALRNENGALTNLHFLFYDIPGWMYYEKEMMSRWGEQYNYILWQLMVRKKVKEWHRKLHFDVIHHLTFNQYRTPSPGLFLDVPFVMGPIGGAETINPAFEQDLSAHTLRKERVRRRGWDLWFWKRWMKRSPAPKYVLCSTRENKARLEPYCEKNGIEVFPAIGFSLKDFSHIPDNNIQSQAFEMAYAGKALDWKGLRLFLHAASLAFVEKDIKDFQIRLIGIRYEEEQKLVKSWVEEYGLTKYVEMIPFMERTKLLTMLKGISLSVYPAFRDSGSMSVLESSALGCPTLCFDAGGQDAFPDDVLLKVPVANDYEVNLHAFAEKLLWAYRNKAPLKEMGMNAQAYVYENMIWGKKVRHYMEVYKCLALKCKG